jgi:hypothetical protein
MKETGFVDGSHLTPADTINDGILSDVFGVTSAVCVGRLTMTALRPAARCAKKLASTGNRVSRSSRQLSSF